MANPLEFAHNEQSTTCNSDESTSSPRTQDYDRKKEPNNRDRDSGVFLSDTEDTLHTTSPRQPPSSPQRTASTKTTLSRADSTRIERLRRPAALNLSSAATADGSKPKSELELQFDLIRNSQTRSKAALKSPTQLLKDRLNLSPTKKVHEVVRIFTPPRPMLNGCILPGPAAQMAAFTRRDVSARTEKGRPAWWCKVDKVVVFDGAEGDEDGNAKFQTRSSKGLSVARRRGDLETIIIPLDCSHCQEMLNRREWKYDIQVCKRTVCWDCKERCRWMTEHEGEVKPAVENEKENTESQTERNRERADSVLQDEQAQEEELMNKVGIEMGPKSPIEAVGGIEERLGKTDGVDGA